MRGMTSSLLIMVAVVVLFGLFGRAMGFEVSILGSLIASVVLTVALNLVLGGFRRRSRFTRHSWR